MKMKLMFLCLIGLSLAARAEDHKASAQAVFDKVAAAFDKSDAAAFSKLWTNDGELINPGGVVGKGREAIGKVAAGDMASILKGGKNKLTVESVRAISPTAIWAEGTHDVTGVKSPDGKDGLHVHLVTLLVLEGGSWMIAEARPYLFLPPPPPPPAGAK